jgi:hypothetical protein
LADLRAKVLAIDIGKEQHRARPPMMISGHFIIEAKHLGAGTDESTAILKLGPRTVQDWHNGFGVEGLAEI